MKSILSILTVLFFLQSFGQNQVWDQGSSFKLKIGSGKANYFQKGEYEIYLDVSDKVGIRNINNGVALAQSQVYTSWRIEGNTLSTKQKLLDSLTLIFEAVSSGSGGGIHQVVAGNGLTNTNDSTLRADTSVLSTISRLNSLLGSKVSGTGTSSGTNTGDQTWTWTFRNDSIIGELSGTGSRIAFSWAVDSVGHNTDSIIVYKGGVRWSYLDKQGVTSVSAGTGMSFTTITGTGAVNADTTLLATRAFVTGQGGGGGSGWALTGSSIATDSSNFLGSTNSAPLQFYVNNALGMKLDQNNRLAINKTTARAGIDVRAGTGTYAQYFIGQTSGSNAGLGLFSQVSDSSTWLGLGAFAIGSTLTAASATPAFIRMAPSGLLIGVNTGQTIGSATSLSSAASTLLTPSGFWTFGTSSVNYGYKLGVLYDNNGGGTVGVVNSNGGSSAKACIDFYASQFGYVYVGGSNYATTALRNAIVVESNEANGVALNATGASSLIRFFQNGATERMRVDANGSIGINTGASNVTTALLQMDSTTKGFLCPRMTTTQRDAISTPAEGLMIYDTTAHKLSVFDGSVWQYAW